MIDAGLGEQAYCYLTTKGRVSGRPHEIEIWFALEGQTLYLLAGSGERADWVRNLRRDDKVSIRIGPTTFEGRAHVVAPDSVEDASARRLLLQKYAPGYGGDLSNWGRTALPVAIELQAG